jgi:phosphonate transport system substrate-binding protein
MSYCRLGMLCLLIAIPLSLSTPAFCAEPPLRFAALPMEGRAILHEQFFGLLHYLEQKIQRPIEMVDFDDYGELLTAFRNDEVDLVYLGPLPYALLAKSDKDVEAVACFHEPNGLIRYTCSLVVSGERQIDLSSAQGLHIGLTQPLSTCGYLAVSQMLQTAGRRLDDTGVRFSYAGSHAEAALGVVRGEYDLAGVKTEIAQRYSHLNLKALMVSREFPGQGLYANRRQLEEQKVEQLRQALLRLDPIQSEQDRLLVSGWGRSLRNGVALPSLCDDRDLLGSVGELPPLMDVSP